MNVFHVRKSVGFFFRFRSIKEVSPSQLTVRGVFPLNTLMFIEIGPHYQVCACDFTRSAEHW